MEDKVKNMLISYSFSEVVLKSSITLPRNEAYKTYKTREHIKKIKKKTTPRGIEDVVDAIKNSTLKEIRITGLICDGESYVLFSDRQLSVCIGLIY